MNLRNIAVKLVKKLNGNIENPGIFNAHHPEKKPISLFHLYLECILPGNILHFD